MSPTFNILVFLVALPIGLTALTRLSQWRLYRRSALVALAVWLAGLLALVAIDRSCSGNLIYGYSDCTGVPRWLSLRGPAYALFAMLGAAAALAGFSLAAAVRAVRRRAR